MMLKKITNKDLEEFVSICRTVSGVNEDWFIRAAIQTKRHYRSHGKSPKDAILEQLEKRWYDSLETGVPAYDVDYGISIIPDLWACWCIYSRSYLKAIASPKSRGTKDSHGNWYNLQSILEDMGDIKSVVDLGCGIGYSTATLKQFFPNAQVYGTNREGSIQYDICEVVAKQYDFEMRSDIDSIGNVDLVFASEYFEHFEEPGVHLSKVITELQPRYLLIANSFNTRSIGHFNCYKMRGLFYHGARIGRYFNDMLRENLYEKQYTKCWNHRPTYWKRIDES